MGVAAGLLLNLALAQWLGARLFWMWWNLSGLLAAVAVTCLASRCMAPPRAEQLQGTTLSTAQLAQGLRAQRRLYLWLLCYGALALGVACWLGVRAA
nr:hypothetical protein [Paucibacter sp. M5-1]MCZ7882521.1 hypothetical protein [Paucibacter sp. M5-1]